MLILITGGSKNGKSHIAENLIASSDRPKFYIATMEPNCDDAFSAIVRHRGMREGKGLKTIEKYTDLHEIKLPPKCAVLLECVCNLCANEMFSAHTDDPVSKILYGIDRLRKNTELFVIVTNQVGDDGIHYLRETMDYIKSMGELNRILAEEADCVIEAVYGIPVILKGERPSCIS